MKAIKITLCTGFILTTLWFLISWINVVSHNGPYDDGDPADWNAFVVFTEVAK